jgi:cytochrome b subunit of formate dehydrogenase
MEQESQLLGDLLSEHNTKFVSGQKLLFWLITQRVVVISY